jgi:hypothetical protein
MDELVPTSSVCALLICVLAGCGDNGHSAEECVPNDTQLCYCSDGSEGTQVCREDKTWSVCDCGDAGADTDVDSDSDTDTGTNDTLENGCNKMDILFVIDNSDSMSEEQEYLIGAFPAFIAAIEAYDVLGTDEPLDYHVGVTSTAVDHNECGDFTCTFEAAEDGVLQNAPLGNNGDCDPPEQAYMEGPDEAVSDQFACVAALGTMGWPYEMPLEAIRRGMTEGFDGEGHVNDENAGFLREDALFVAIIITDEDDVSRADTYPTNPLAPTPDPAPVTAYAEVMLEIKDSYDRMVFGLISGPNNTDCESAFGDADAAPRLHEFRSLVGSYGAWGDICAEDLGAEIDNILETIALACDEFPPIE